jgi:hypothetical protein
MAVAAVGPQAEFDEEPLEDAEIEQALEEWQRSKEDVETTKAFAKSAEKIAQGLIGEKDLDEGTYRCGRFIVKIADVPAHQRVRSKPAKA